MRNRRLRLPPFLGASMGGFIRGATGVRANGVVLGCDLQPHKREQQSNRGKQPHFEMPPLIWEMHFMITGGPGGTARFVSGGRSRAHIPSFIDSFIHKTCDSDNKYRLIFNQFFQPQ